EELLPLFVEEGAEVPRAQLVLERAVADLAAQPRLDRAQEAGQAVSIFRRVVLPADQVDVVEAVDAKRRAAGGGQGRADRPGRPAEAGEAELVEAGAIGVAGVARGAGGADGVRAEQGDQELGVAEALLDLLLPFLARAETARVLPDVVALGLEVGVEAVGQVEGVAAAVAEEEAGLGPGRLGGRLPAVVADVADPVIPRLAEMDLGGATSGAGGRCGGHGGVSKD